MVGKKRNAAQSDDAGESEEAPKPVKKAKKPRAKKAASDDEDDDAGESEEAPKPVKKAKKSRGKKSRASDDEDDGNAGSAPEKESRQNMQKRIAGNRAEHFARPSNKSASTPGGSLRPSASTADANDAPKHWPGPFSVARRITADADANRAKREAEIASARRNGGLRAPPGEGADGYDRLLYALVTRGPVPAAQSAPGSAGGELVTPVLSMHRPREATGAAAEAGGGGGRAAPRDRRSGPTASLQRLCFSALCSEGSERVTEAAVSVRSSPTNLVPSRPFSPSLLAVSSRPLSPLLVSLGHSPLSRTPITNLTSRLPPPNTSHTHTQHILLLTHTHTHTHTNHAAENAPGPPHCPRDGAWLPAQDASFRPCPVHAAPAPGSRARQQQQQQQQQQS